MSQNNIVDSIKSKLNEIEQKENVRIIMAVESGSRAWGFESPDSDYDVRFVYVRNTADYLKLLPVRDVIEWQLDDVFDVSGWDLKKALVLLHDSNPTLHEWCNSPIVYKENELADAFRTITAEHFIPKKALFHYHNMAEHAYKNYLTGDEVKIKKYFYGIRPLLAAQWVVEHQSAPPMLFDELVEAQLDSKLVPIVQELLEMKKNTPETGLSPKIPELDVFIRMKLEEIRLQAEAAENRKNPWGALDAFFANAVI